MSGWEGREKYQVDSSSHIDPHSHSSDEEKEGEDLDTGMDPDGSGPVKGTHQDCPKREKEEDR